MDNNSKKIEPNTEEDIKKFNQEETKRRRRESKSFKNLSLILAIMFVSFVSGMLGAGLIFKTTTDLPNIATTSKVDGNELLTGNEKSISQVVEKVGPSVVSIMVETQANTMYGLVRQQGAGTGVIISDDGYIMTNKHVVGDADSVSVMLENGRVYENTKVIGADPLNDIAFLKLSGAKDLPVVTLGDSSTVKVGQQVIAIGNALGQYQNTVTTGILSGVGRPITASNNDGSGQEDLVDLLQTDAAINSGNSGGPLVNLTGQVIGINTAIAADANNIGFAIPINSTKGLINELFKTGKVQRAFLGVSFIDITPAIATQNDLPVKEGAYIPNESSISPDSPAEKAGLKAKDIILKVGDNKIGGGQGLSTVIGMYQPGQKVTLLVLRDNKEITLDVTLAAFNSQR